MITFIAKHVATELYNSRIIKRRSSSLMPLSLMSFNVLQYITNPESTDFLLDWIYIKRPRSLTPFLKKIVPACFPLDNT